MALRVPSAVAALVALSALAVLTTAACATSTGTPAAAPAAPAGTTAFTPVTTAGTTATTPVLRFPNTNLTVRLTGYDTTTGMVTFTRVTWIPGGPDDGHYAPYTPDPGSHRLPLAANLVITSWSMACTGTEGDGPGDLRPCTTQRFVASLLPGGDGLSVADLHVDGTDHIATVREIFTP